MNEDQNNKINILFDQLLDRLKHEIEHQPAPMLPALANAMVILHGYKTGLMHQAESHAADLRLVQNLNRQINRELGDQPPKE